MQKPLRTAVLLLLALACASCRLLSAEKQPADRGATTVLRFAEPMPPTHPSAMASQAFADLVSERTQGRIEIHVSFNAALGSEQEALDQLSFGGIAFARVNLLSLADGIPALQRYTAPFSYTSTEQIMTAMAADEDAILKALVNSRMTPLVTLLPDARCFANNRHPLAQLSDVSGLTINTLPVKELTRYIYLLGANPVTVKAEGVIRSLGNGFIDGAEMTLLTYTEGNYSAFLPYLTMNNGFPCPDLILAGNVSLGSLSGSDQQLIRQCGRDIFESHKTRLLKAQTEALASLRRSGAVVEGADRLDLEIKAALNDSNFT